MTIERIRLLINWHLGHIRICTDKGIVVDRVYDKYLGEIEALEWVLSLMDKLDKPQDIEIPYDEA